MSICVVRDATKGWARLKPSTSRPVLAHRTHSLAVSPSSSPLPRPVFTTATSVAETETSSASVSVAPDIQPDPPIDTAEDFLPHQRPTKSWLQTHLNTAESHQVSAYRRADGRHEAQALRIIRYFVDAHVRVGDKDALSKRIWRRALSTPRWTKLQDESKLQAGQMRQEMANEVHDILDDLVQEVSSRNCPSRFAIVDHRFDNSSPVGNVRHPISLQNETQRTYYRNRASDHSFLFTHLAAACKTTPLKLDDVSSITIQSLAVFEISGTKQSNMWFDHNGTGCAIIVGPPNSQGDCKVVFDGAKEARETAMRRVIDQAKAFMSADSVASKEKHIISKRVLSLQQSHPEGWTLRTFLQHIEGLVHSEKKRTSTRITDHRNSGAEHTETNTTIAKSLLSMFTSEETLPYASVRALNKALSFCRNHSELSHFAHSIWEAAIRLGLRPDVACFNQEIGRSLVVKNRSRVISLLKAMTTLGVKADKTTCSIVLRFTENPGQRLKILALANRHTDQDDKRGQSALIYALIRTDLLRFLQNPSGLNDFAQYMQGFFGNVWLDTKGVALMLRVANMRDSPRQHRLGAQRAPAILQLARQHGVDMDNIDTDARLQITSAMKSIGNIEHAVLIFIATFRDGFRGQAQHALDQLFLLAYRRHRYNTCRVIWTQAVALGCLSFRVQNKVNADLSSNQGMDETDSPQRHRRLISKFIIGAAGAIHLDSVVFPNLSQLDAWPDLHKLLLTWQPRDVLRTEQLQLIHAILERELRTFKYFEPLEHQDFLQLLQEAHELDDQWAQDETVLNTDPIALIQQRRPINLPPRRTSVPQHLVPFRRSRLFNLNGHQVDLDNMSVQK